MRRIVVIAFIFVPPPNVPLPIVSVRFAQDLSKKPQKDNVTLCTNMPHFKSLCFATPLNINCSLSRLNWAFTVILCRRCAS